MECHCDLSQLRLGPIHDSIASNPLSNPLGNVVLQPAPTNSSAFIVTSLMVSLLLNDSVFIARPNAALPLAFSGTVFKDEGFLWKSTFLGGLGCGAVLWEVFQPAVYGPVIEAPSASILVPTVAGALVGCGTQVRCSCIFSYCGGALQRASQETHSFGDLHFLQRLMGTCSVITCNWVSES